MELQRVALVALLQATFHSADAQVLGLTDPKLCYILDGILFLYAIIITALFMREKCTKSKHSSGAPETDDIYNKLAVGQREEYDALNKSAGDAEKGGRKQPRRKNPQDTVYSALQKDKMGGAYSEIGIKGEQQRRRGKGNDGIYQGLSAATKDTYDALQMQPLPPR
ncbi:T-cell surface glycoprotein CD3 zeta chain isoform X2 [Pleurodeles waltl]|uniref:T-cell surface glycoprotein CD3 zeta chain isoform X2 n=1 Tax=Pleurodeles waltl TaxID=8319 RepID=UPI00370975F5